MTLSCRHTASAPKRHDIGHSSFAPATTGFPSCPVSFLYTFSSLLLADSHALGSAPLSAAVPGCHKCPPITSRLCMFPTCLFSALAFNSLDVLRDLDKDCLGPLQRSPLPYLSHFQSYRTSNASSFRSADPPSVPLSSRAHPRHARHPELDSSVLSVLLLLPSIGSLLVWYLFCPYHSEYVNSGVCEFASTRAAAIHHLL